MSMVRNVTVMLALAVASTGATPVVFIGLSNQGAPAIEKNLTRLIDGHLATLPGVTLVSNDETVRLRSRIDQLTYPVMTARLAATLRRCMPDSGLVVWGVVRECSVRPVRHLFFGARIRATLSMELLVFNLAEQTYAYVGDANARVERSKGFVFWFGAIENAIAVSAPEKAELVELVQVEGVKAGGRVLQNLFIHTQLKNRKKEPPAGIKKTEVTIEPSAAEEAPADSAPSGDEGVMESEPADEGEVE